MEKLEKKPAEMVVLNVVESAPSRIDIDVAARKFLVDRYWPTGLINALISGFDGTPARFFICDDSSSMLSSDGHWVVGEGAQTK